MTKPELQVSEGAVEKCETCGDSGWYESNGHVSNGRLTFDTYPCPTCAIGVWATYAHSRKLPQSVYGEMAKFQHEPNGREKAFALIRDPRFNYFDGLTWAVFNCNREDMENGKLAVVAKFGEGGWGRVQGYMKTGIMELFNYAPTPETLLYAETVGLSAEQRHATLDAAKEGK